jgi:hypothetical protein
MANKQQMPGNVGGQSNAVGSILDGIITGIFGPNPAEMSEADRKRTEANREADRQEAYAMANSARKNPGAQWMAGPSMGGGDTLQTLGNILKFFGGMGG